ncbi:MAG: IPT/TIG domain-containing protein [Acidobacteria bacterium]|nr:IPT/TIG domain-containing protein [Acidobacteriota bacterium]
MKPYKILGLILTFWLLTCAHGLAQRTLYFPHVVFGVNEDGTLYRSTIIVFNLSDQTATATLDFFDDNGRPAITALFDHEGTRLGPDSSFNLAIAPQGVRRYITDSPAIRVGGWGRLRASQNLSGSLIFQQQDRSGTILAEAGVFASPVLKAFTIFHDSSRPETGTGLALVNPSPADSITVSLRMYSLSGSQIGVTRNITLAPLNHLARFLTDAAFFPEAVRTEGYVTVSSSGDIVPLTLRIDGIQLTTIPVIPGGRDIPVLGAITPSQGPPGTTVTIDGQNFSTTAANNLVRFGATTAVVATSTASRLVTSVPNGATSGPVTVTVDGYTSNGLPFTVTSGSLTPAIVSILPNSVRAGGDEFDLTVIGNNFLPDSRIRFGGGNVSTTFINTITLKGRVSRELIASPGQVTVVVVNAIGPFGGAESNPVNLQITSEGSVGTPEITVLDPNTGFANSRVYIRGNNFEPVIANNLVKFSGVTALVRSATPNLLEVVVPNGVSTGPVTVTARNRTSNRASFTVNAIPRLAVIPVGRYPQTVAYNPVNQTAVVASLMDSSLYIIDLASNSVLTSFASGGGTPSGLAIEPNLNVALIAHRASAGRVMGYADLTNNTLGRFISLRNLVANPNDVAINPNTSMAIITDRTSAVTFYDLNTNQELDGAGLTNPDRVVVHPLTNQAFITDFVNNLLFIFDMATKTIRSRIPVGNLPLGLAVSPSTNTVVVVNNLDNSVSLIDLITERVRLTIPVGVRPNSVAINPNTNVAVVTNNFDSTVSIIDLNAERVIETRRTGGNGPQGVAINPVNNTAIVSNSDSNDVSIIRLPY